MKFPRGNPTGSDEQAPLATGGWAKLTKSEFRTGDIWIGRTSKGDPVGYDDDRHMITVAGSRGGKGRSCIVPNLCLYPGSCVVLDPKGENASITAEMRKSIQPDHKVFVLDPFGIADVPESVISSFNPLDLIENDDPLSIDNVALLSEAIVESTTAKDAHWDESARSLLEALILFVCAVETGKRRNLITVRKLLLSGLEPSGSSENRDSKSYTANQTNDLLKAMVDTPSFDGVVASRATSLIEIGPSERSSIFSTLRRNTKFLDSPAMSKVLSKSQFDPDSLKNSAKGVTLYLCLPASRLGSHSRWLRLIIVLLMSRMESLGPNVSSHVPVLFILDEFASLGYMPSLEKAAGLMAGYNVKIWPILQDLTQLQRHYRDSWETFLGNAGILQFFSNTDTTTLNYVSARLGETEISRELSSISETNSTSNSESTTNSESESESGDMEFNSKSNTSSNSESDTSSTSRSYSKQLFKVPLMPSEEIFRYFSRESGMQILFFPGLNPIALSRTNYDQDELFANILGISNP